MTTDPSSAILLAVALTMLAAALVLSVHVDDHLLLLDPP
jgi:hypothetical protein